MDRAAPVVWTAPPMPKGPKNGEKDDVPVPGLPRAWLPMKEVLVTEAGVSESASAPPSVSVLNDGTPVPPIAWFPVNRLLEIVVVRVGFGVEKKKSWL